MSNDLKPEEVQKEIETKEVETKEVETKEVETKEVETKEVETKEIETKEVETKEVETKEVETKEVETKEVETKEVETKEVETKEDEVKVSKENIVTETLTIETNEVELTIEDNKNSMLLNIFIDLLANEEELNKLKLNLKLEPKHVHLIQKITELLPSLFDDLSDSISKIYEDKVLDSKDIPSLVILMKNSYRKCIHSKELVRNIKGITLEDSIDFIKNVLLILIEIGHIKVQNKDDVISMLHMCVDLLTSTVDISSSLFDTFKNCLCC